MSATISETVNGALRGRVPGGYQNIVDDVIRSLEEREYGIADQAVQVAQSAGASDARSLVAETGLSLRPEPETAAAEETTPGGAPMREVVEDILTGLTNLVDSVRGKLSR